MTTSLTHLPTEAEFTEQLRQLVGEEDIEKWQRAISFWMQQSDSKAVSLKQLQQSLVLPLIEVWLGLLLGERSSTSRRLAGNFTVMLKIFGCLLPSSASYRSTSSRVAESITFFYGCKGKLPLAFMAFEPLFTVMNATILDRLGRLTGWASRHD